MNSNGAVEKHRPYFGYPTAKCVCTLRFYISHRKVKEKINESHSEEVALCTCVSAGEGISLQNLALREARHRSCASGFHRPRHRYTG